MVLSFPYSPCLPFLLLRWALQGGGAVNEVMLRSLWLMNGTFEVSSLAWCPKPASPVVGVNWPVVWLSGSMPNSLTPNLVSPELGNNNLHFKTINSFPVHDDASIHCLWKLFSVTIITHTNIVNTCSLLHNKVLMILMVSMLLNNCSGTFH